MRRYRTRVKLAYLSLSWLLISWWPHDNLHLHNGMNLQGLLYIEYGFHLTLIIASLILARAFVQTLKTAYVRTPQASERLLF